MADKEPEFFTPAAAAFNFNNVTGGGAESGSGGGSGGSGMDCLQLRSPPPGPFHYLISEQAKSLVALQELQNEVGALLEFRDLVIETFPNLRSKMAPSTPAEASRREWEPGVRVRRKLAAAGDAARAKPQPSVQDSGFSTETSCGKDVHSSASAQAARARPLEDELWALLDVIQRKGVRLRDEADSLRGELDERHSNETAEESFARALTASECECSESRRLREERDALLSRAAELEARALRPAASPRSPRTPLGRLDRALAAPPTPHTHPTPDSNKIAAILHESNPVELQRQLLTSTVHTQILSEKLRRAADQRTALLDKLERARDANDDLKFQLEEKTIELEGARAKVRQLEGKMKTPASERTPDRDSMRDLEPVAIPEARAAGAAGAEAEGGEARIAETPRRARPSRIPRHTRRRDGASPPRPPSAGSHGSASHGAASHGAASHGSARSRHSAVPVPVPRRAAPPAPPTPPPDKKVWGEQAARRRDVGGEAADDGGEYLVVEYVRRAARLPRHWLPPAPHSPRAADLASELARSILYQDVSCLELASLAPPRASRPPRAAPAPSPLLWNNKPQQYFECMKYFEDEPDENAHFERDSLAP